jgi:iron complex transport system permease protein
VTAAIQPGAAVERRNVPLARRAFPLAIMVALVALLLIAAAIAASIGPAKISLGRIAAALFEAGGDPLTVNRDQIILMTIRLPRIVMSSIVGALLAGAGAIMQGLFRNPLADPGLVGVSAGASLAAAAAIVAGDKAAPFLTASAPFLLPIAAFCGALATTAMLYRVATWEGRTSIATMLLAGLALGALAGAGTGLLVFLADDRHARHHLLDARFARRSDLAEDRRDRSGTGFAAIIISGGRPRPRSAGAR